LVEADAGTTDAGETSDDCAELPNPTPNGRSTTAAQEREKCALGNPPLRTRTLNLQRCNLWRCSTSFKELVRVSFASSSK
jgi:hypothetical protein